MEKLKKKNNKNKGRNCEVWNIGILQNFWNFCRTFANFAELLQNFCKTFADFLQNFFRTFAFFAELLQCLQNFCNVCKNFFRIFAELLQRLQNVGTFGTFGGFAIFAEFLQNFCRIFAELLELWESQEFKLNKSWLSIDQCVGKCIKSIKLDKIRETDEKKRTYAS